MTLKTFAGAFGSGVLVLGLAGCGGSNSGEGAGYCETIADLDAKSIADVDPTNSDDVAEVAGVFNDIASQAPDDIRADWDVVASLFGDLADGMDPLNVEQSRVTELEKAMAKIEKQVKADCDIEL